MALSGTVEKAPAGIIGFDHSSAALTEATAKHYFDKGFRFCVRYVSRDQAGRDYHRHHGSPDLTEVEAQTILDAGLALMAVQHVAPTGWVPHPSLGTTYGRNAATYADAAGLPPGVNVWLDLEDIPQGTPHEDIVGYCNAWFKEVDASGFEPGVYVGFNVWLSPDELFFDLRFKHYWKAGGHIPEVSHRGYQLIQYIQKTSEGEFDKNVTQDDAFGGGVFWLTTNPVATA